MPSWSDLNPADIAPHLPIVWSYKYDGEQTQFFGRLAGDRITKAIAKNFRGLPLSELHPAETAQWVDAICRRVATEPAMYSYSGEIFAHKERKLTGERIILPLSSDGTNGDGVLGATDCPIPFQEPGVLIAPIDSGHRWVSL